MVVENAINLLIYVVIIIVIVVLLVWVVTHLLFVAGGIQLATTTYGSATQALAPLQILLLQR